ncbi:hypothetical protein ACFWUU_37515 [Kribbella sp. NPDC058693]|uniref:hypothetical protein n=1 Tax=Kribbella sp. NPDC058693 TaxID=3346602 RepID=UPI003652CE62
MIERLPEPFQGRLGRLAAAVVVGRRATAIEQAIELACDLISYGLAPQTVVDVAALSPNETWREAGPIVLTMIETLGIHVPDPTDNAAEWELLLRAFGFWDLPVADFYGPFLHQLPAWDKQSAMERSITRLLDELDRETTPAGKAAVVERIRATVRGALE